MQFIFIKKENKSKNRKCLITVPCINMIMGSWLYAKIVEVQNVVESADYWLFGIVFIGLKVIKQVFIPVESSQVMVDLGSPFGYQLTIASCVYLFRT